MIHRRILILMFIAATVCVMSVGMGAACERMDLMEGKSGAVKVLGRLFIIFRSRLTFKIKLYSYYL